MDYTSDCVCVGGGCLDGSFLVSHEQRVKGMELKPSDYSYKNSLTRP